MANVLKCQNCGSNLSKRTGECDYCGALIDKSHEENTAVTEHKNSIFNLPPGEGEFGISGKRCLSIAALISIILYLAGWFYEDTQYWLDTKAMIIWTAVLPAYILAFAAMLKQRHGQIMLGIAIFVLITMVYLSVILLIRKGINDDMVGISMLIGSVSAFAWYIGRFLHLWIRQIRSKQQT